MTPEKRAEIRKRCEAATAGPWQYDEMTPLSEGLYQWGEVNVADDSYTVAEVENSAAPFICRIAPQLNTPSHEQDGQFIAHARTDLPLALEALEAAEQRVGELEALAGEDKIALFYRLKNEQARAAIRETAGCRACQGRIATLERALAESEAKGAEVRKALVEIGSFVPPTCDWDGLQVVELRHFQEMQNIARTALDAARKEPK